MLYQRLEALQLVSGKEVNRVDIIRTFLKRRVQPLQARVHSMFLYACPNDPTRVSSEELSSGDLDRVLCPLMKFKDGEDLPGESLTPPLSASKGASKVMFVRARCAFPCFCLFVAVSHVIVIFLLAAPSGYGVYASSA